jgi:damage-control phosphatase, subfamily I
MKANLECIPCFLKQTIEASRMSTDDVQKHEEAVKEVMAFLQKESLHASPPEISKHIHQIIRSVTKNKDPYLSVKKKANINAAKAYHTLQEKMRQSSDPLETAINLAIIGNVIDFGTERRFSLEETIETHINNSLNKDALDEFKKRLEKATEILYLADNAGEIFFDKLLINYIKNDGNHITYVVKANPIINDALLEDAKEAHIDEFATVLEGDKQSTISCPGMILSNASNEFVEKMKTADIIIAKGQGNYEALNEINRDIFFLLMVKCPLIAHEIKEGLGTPVFKYKAKK